LGLEPTGRQIEIDEISIFRVENGKVAEQWCLVDYLTLMRQLGCYGK
jgi:predicted ester cyclase